ncbi:EamA family transporter [Microcoleus sp. LEGE 07076]|uniref:EamA family transporter n=1 Tax=Microcoleus sp. LEGE 07076 TaxID=915322 RepID=UPI00187F9348|nr:EamA family transporter [Microcoleus sp. LEGE 07076]MBE9185156.1 EamA family transporter [Microcoleus sp. LEGE 07076]
MLKIADWLIYALCCSLLYGFWGFFSKLATQYIDYNTAFVYEAVGAILATLLIIVKTNNFNLQGDLRGIIFALLVGVCGTVASLVFFIAIAKGPVASTVSITSLYPIVTVLLSFIFLKEPITLFQTLALFFAVVAVILSSL